MPEKNLNLKIKNFNFWHGGALCCALRNKKRKNMEKSLFKKHSGLPRLLWTKTSHACEKNHECQKARVISEITSDIKNLS